MQINRTTSAKIPARLAPAALCVLLLAGGLVTAAQKPEKAFRFSIRYFEGKFTLLKCEELNKILSPTLKARILKEDEKPRDFYFEILDARGKVLLRSRMHDPTVSLMEYPDPQDPTKIRSALVKHEDVVFTVLVAAPPGGKSIRFLRMRSAEPGVVAAPGPEEFGTFELKVIG